jgi:hypothetical protein
MNALLTEPRCPESENYEQNVDKDHKIDGSPQYE